jgi:hypothetical protein
MATFIIADVHTLKTTWLHSIEAETAELALEAFHKGQSGVASHMRQELTSNESVSVLTEMPLGAEPVPKGA